MEGILILRNSVLKLKMVVNNAILRNNAVSSENISKSIKIKTENVEGAKIHCWRKRCHFSLCFLEKRIFAPSYMARFRLNSILRQICSYKNPKYYAFEGNKRFSISLVLSFLFRLLKA
jgi:hypothetical protein